MNKAFSLDSPLIKLLTKVADLMLVNLCFIISALPLLTIGASLSALNYVTLKMVEDQEVSILHQFWGAFKRNFKQGTALWAIVCGMSAVLFAWYIIIDNLVLLQLAAVLRIFLYLFSAIGGMMSIYLFYLQAKFENSLKETLKNAFLMSIRHFLTTVLSLAVIGAVLLVIIFYPRVIGYGLFFVLGGFAFVSFLLAFLMKRVFARYI